MRNRISFHILKAMVSVLLVSLVLCTSCSQDRISGICAHHGINLQRTHFKVVEKSEQWCPNGDGELFVRLSLSSTQKDRLNNIISQMKNSGAIEMPMLNQHAKVLSGKSANYVERLETGLYLIDVNKRDPRNYDLIVYDEAKKELIIQIVVY